MAWRDRDHTRGSLLASLFVLALPLLAASLAMVVFQVVDLTFISRLGEAPLAAVVIVNQTLRQFVFMLMMGGSFATQALIARAVGEGHPERAEHVAGQSIVLGGLLAAVVAIVGGLFAEALFALPGPDASFFPYGVPYLRWAFVLSFGIAGTQTFSAILGGAGDTTTPLLVTIVQMCVAVFGEWVLIFGHLGFPALGVRGVALGVGLGHVAALSIGLSVLFRGRARVHLRRRHLVPDPVVLRRIASLAWPPALQMLGGVSMTFAFLRLAGTFGESVQAAYAIGLRLGMIVPAFCFPLAGACATLVGQALGTGDRGRAWRAVGIGLAVHGSVMLGFAVFTFFFRGAIIAAFSDDPEVIRIGSEYLLYASGAFAMWAFYFVFFRTLQGAGDVVVPMAITLGGNLFLAIPLGFGLVRLGGFGPEGIWIAFLVNSVVLTLATGAWMATGRWTRRDPLRTRRGAAPAEAETA